MPFLGLCVFAVLEFEIVGWWTDNGTSNLNHASGNILTYTRDLHGSVTGADEQPTAAKKTVNVSGYYKE